MTIGRRIQKFFGIRSDDEGLMLIPFSFDINGTSDPVKLHGDNVVSVKRVEAGEFTLTLRNRAVAIFGGFAVASTGDDVDIYGKVNWDSFLTAGTCTVRFNTAAVETDPADKTHCAGFLMVRRVNREARANPARA